MELTKEEAQRIASRLELPTKAFIGGHLCDASDGLTFETINSANAQVIANVVHCMGTDVDHAVIAARRPPCGTVAVNGFSEGDIKTPFGGYKRSGSLSRDNGTEALDQYLQTKTVWISTGLSK